MGETLNNHEWLARSGLSWQSLMEKPPATQAMIGRQWKQYSACVEGVCKELGLKPEQLEGFPKEKIPFWQPELMPKSQQQIEYKVYRNAHTILPEMKRAQGLL